MSRTPGRCRGRSQHVRTGADDDAVMHWPCDAVKIAQLVPTGTIAEVAAMCGVTPRTVARWRGYLRTRELPGWLAQAKPARPKF